MDKLVFLAALAATVITALETLSRVLQSRLESQTHNRLLDKFSSAKDFAEFLQSPGADAYLSALADRFRDPTLAIVGSVRAGLISSFLGLACFTSPVQAAAQGFPVEGVGVLALALGAGFLAAALASHLLSKKYGLFPRRDIA